MSNVFTPIRLFAVPVVGKRLTYAGERSSEVFEEFFWHGMNYAVLPSMSSTGSLIFDSGFSPLIRAMMDCAASSPMRSISWRTVVKSGINVIVRRAPSAPTTLISPGALKPRCFITLRQIAAIVSSPAKMPSISGFSSRIFATTALFSSSGLTNSTSRTSAGKPACSTTSR